jgi:hypothetical protein
MNPHGVHELRSLAMHRIVRRKLEQSPGDVVRYGLENLQRWRRQGVECEDFDVWENLLTNGLDRLQTLLEDDSAEAVRLRQSSPFVGLVPEPERLAIMASIR